jgi:hypothetical protein
MKKQDKRFCLHGTYVQVEEAENDQEKCVFCWEVMRPMEERKIGMGEGRDAIFTRVGRECLNCLHDWGRDLEILRERAMWPLEVLSLQGE